MSAILYVHGDEYANQEFSRVFEGTPVDQVIRLYGLSKENPRFDLKVELDTYSFDLTLEYYELPKPSVAFEKWVNDKFIDWDELKAHGYWWADQTVKEIGT